MRSEWQIGIGALLLLLASPVAGAGRSGGAATAHDGPWFNPKGCKRLEKTWATSSGAYSRDDPGRITCDLQIHVCGDVIERSQDVDKSQGCPSSLNYKSVPVRVVCCDKWRNGQTAGSQCNGTVDADCDGIPNQDDDEPLTPSQPKPAVPSP